LGQKRVNEGLTKTIAAVFVVLLVAGTLVGYYVGSSMAPGKTSTSPQKYTFYAIGWTLQDPWLASFYNGMSLAGNMTNSKVVMVESGGGAEGFTNGFEQAIAASPNGIMLGYWYPDAMASAFQSAKQKKIPICTFDVQAPPEMAISIGFVGWSNLEVGSILAERVTRGFTPGGCAIISHDVGQLWSVQRSQGIKDYFAEHFPNVPVEVVDNSVAMTSETQSVELLRSYHTAHPGVDVYIGLGPQDTHALISLVEEQNLVGVLKLGAVDITDRVMTAIKDGKVIAAVSQQPFFQGFLATMWLYNYNEYGFIPPVETPTGPTVVDINSVDKIQLQLDKTGGA
jgi:simple sugar transport system substrate-binding protein